MEIGHYHHMKFVSLTVNVIMPICTLFHILKHSRIILMHCKFSNDCFTCPLSDCKLSTHISIVHVNELPYDKEYPKELKAQIMHQIKADR